MRESTIMSDALDEAGESIFPLMMGFFLFWLWIAEDFPFFDKLIMTSLVFGVEFMLVLGLSQPLREISPQSMS